MTTPTDESDDPASRNRWRKIYAAVIANTLLVLVLIYFFSRHYAG